MIKPNSFTRNATIFVCLAFFIHNTFAESAASRARIKHFDLPGQVLQLGLIEFALQADVTVITDSEVIKGYRSSPVVGPQTIDTALQGLLSNTLLSFNYQPDIDSYIIQKKADEVVVMTAPPLTQSQSPEQVEEVVVTSLSYPLRYHTVTNTQLHGGMSYFDSSRFLNVIPQSLIQDQQASELGDVLKYASGITPGDGINDSNDDVFIRDFRRHALYVDGFRLSENTGVKLLPANIERVEILKGPSTLLYGQAEPGGIVNAVRKKPRDESFANTQFGLGSGGQRYVNADINSQIPGLEDGNFRIVLADETKDESADIRNIHQQLIATSASWQPLADTRIDMGYEYQHAEHSWDREQQILMPLDGVFDAKSLKDLTRQARPELSTRFNLFNVELNHSFSSDWRLSARYVWHDEERLGVRTVSDTLLTTDIFLKRDELGKDFFLFILGGQMAVPVIMFPREPESFYKIGRIRTLYDEQAFETENNISLNLEGSFDTGALTHHLTVGGDWHQQDVYKKYTIEMRDLFPSLTLTDTSFGENMPAIFDTILDQAQPLGVLETKEFRLLYDDYGIYIQDNIELNERWIISAGGRYTVTTGEHVDITDWEFTSLQTYEHFSTQLGLVYKPTPKHSIYFNYSEALRANYHVDDIGPRKAPPETSDQVEIGVKSLLFDGKLLSSVALFDINKRNIVDLEVVEGFLTSLSSHQQRVRGLDADLTWQLSSGLNLVGAFSLIDPEIISGANTGNQPAMSADQTASLFANYRFQNGLELSGGYKYVNKRFADDENRFWLGEYATVDLGLTYPFQVFSTESRMQISVKNLLDEQFYTAILGGVRMNESEGRAVVGSLRIEF